MTTTTAPTPLKGKALRDFIASVELKSGNHTPNGEFCFMEAVSRIGGFDWTDQTPGVSPVIGAFARSWNDGMDDTDRQQLKPYLVRVLGTAASEEIESRRSWMALDWYCRVSAPAWLRVAGLTAAAEAVEDIAPIMDAKSAKRAQAALESTRATADAAGAAAGAAARAAAGAALRPTVVTLQASALDLLDRMIEAA